MVMDSHMTLRNQGTLLWVLARAHTGGAQVHWVRGWHAYYVAITVSVIFCAVYFSTLFFYC